MQLKLMLIIFSVLLSASIITGSGIYAERIPEIEGNEMKDSTIVKAIIDSDYNLDDALEGIEIPHEIRKNLTIIDVEYYSFDEKLHRGQVVITRELKDDIKKIFVIIKNEKFPIAKAIPIVRYNWEDEKSMEDNNTSAFNYRFIAGTKKLSNHSYGRAIDINPLFNPYIRKDLHQPKGSIYIPSRQGTISKDSFLVDEFKKLGWEWGGNWSDRKDYQHFEKH